MSTPYKPDDYSTVSPYLIVDGASETIDFRKQVFGAVELRRFPGNGNKLTHAEVWIDDTVLLLTLTIQGPYRAFGLTPPE